MRHNFFNRHAPALGNDKLAFCKNSYRHHFPPHFAIEPPGLPRKLADPPCPISPSF
jgi:hypothetical protein